MIEEALRLAVQLTALVVLLGIGGIFFRGHRYVLNKAMFLLVPRIRQLPWAESPTESGEGQRFGISLPRLRWKAAWLLAGLGAGSVLGLLIGLSAAFVAFWGYEVIESLFAGSSPKGNRSGSGFDPAGNAAHGITMMLITAMITLPFVLSGASIGLALSHAITATGGRSTEPKPQFDKKN